MGNEQIFMISYFWRKGHDTFDIAKAMSLPESEVDQVIHKYVLPRSKKRRAA